MKPTLAIVFLASTVLGSVLKPHEEISCEDDGYYPDPYDCSGYYVCKGGTAEWHPCPDHLQLRWESRQAVHCDIPEKVKCTPMYAADVPNQANRLCSGRADGIYQDAFHCHRFVMCSSGTRLDFECPDEMSYDEHRGVCIRNSQCRRDGMMTEAETSSGEMPEAISEMGSGEVMVAEVGSGDEKEVVKMSDNDTISEKGTVEELKKNISLVLEQDESEDGK